ncbi:MAG: tetratricopeptide repeat protein, partial [Aquisalinus sp.]|nr:tetratricopeptide repeat protein [Aquisalinus sp.]
MIKPPKLLSFIFVAGVAAYVIAFWVMVTVDSESAQSRFDVLISENAYGRSIGHGEQLIALRMEEGATPDDLAATKLHLANAHREKGKPDRAVDLYRDVLA